MALRKVFAAVLISAIVATLHAADGDNVAVPANTDGAQITGRSFMPFGGHYGGYAPYYGYGYGYGYPAYGYGYGYPYYGGYGYGKGYYGYYG